MLSVLLYNFIGILAYIFALGVEKGKTKGQRFLCRFLVFNIFFIPAAIRYDIGTDYSSYVDIYNSSIMLSDMEYGFRFIVNILHMMDLPSQALFVFTSFLMYFPICFLLKDDGYSVKIFVYFIVFYLYSLNVIRNSIAISFLILAIEFLSRKKYTYTCLWFVLACLFHYSSFFFVPLFFVNNISFNKRILLCLIGGGVYLAITNKFFLLFNMPLFVDSKYGIYVGSTHSNAAEIGTGLGVAAYMFVPLYIIAIFIYVYRMNYNIIIIGLSMYIISYLLALKVEILGRLADIYSLLFVSAIVNIIKGGVISNRYFYLKYIPCILLYLLFQIQIINNKKNNLSGGHGIYPYETIFSKY